MMTLPACPLRVARSVRSGTRLEAFEVPALTRRATLRRFPSRAFTLIEVLLAVALFAIAVVVLAGAYVNVIEGVESVRSDRAFEQELRWIREKVLLETDLEKVEEGDEVPTPDFGNARWEAVVEPTGVADLFLISLHVEMEGND
ncbi:MAG TPA: type II secretion system protein, partial [Opitutaceae bacterium]|nr:type II secretion system protein [Opitutaceae bacterium]